MPFRRSLARRAGRGDVVGNRDRHGARCGRSGGALGEGRAKVTGPPAARSFSPTAKFRKFQRSFGNLVEPPPPPSKFLSPTIVEVSEIWSEPPPPPPPPPPPRKFLSPTSHRAPMDIPPVPFTLPNGDIVPFDQLSPAQKTVRTEWANHHSGSWHARTRWPVYEKLSTTQSKG